MQLELDRVAAHARADSAAQAASRTSPGAEHRLELCRLAVAGDERFAVSALEIAARQDRRTRSILFRSCIANAPDNELFLIVGGDVAAGLPDWREPERVLSLATLAVAKRRGTPAASRSRRRSSELRRRRAGASSSGCRGSAISSTMIRRRVRAGEPIRYIVPDAVARLHRGAWPVWSLQHA